MSQTLQAGAPDRQTDVMRYRTGWLCGAILALGMLVRLAGLTGQGLWHDEMYTLANTRGFDLYLFEGADLQQREPLRPAQHYKELLSADRFWPQLTRNIVHEGHPPAYFFLARASTQLLDSHSAAALRSLSLLGALGAMIALSAAGGRTAGARAALAAAGVAAASPFAVYFAAEARSYALAMAALGPCFVVFAGGLGGRALSGRALWTYLISGILATYTHYYALIAVLAMGVTLMLVSHHARRPASLAASLAVPAAMLPWAPVLRLQTRAHAGTHWTEGILGMGPQLGAILDLPPFLLLGPAAEFTPAAVLVTVAFAAVAVALWRSQPGARSVVAGMALFAGLNTAGVIAADLLTGHHTIAVPRYSFALWYPLSLVLALALARLSRASRLGTAAAAATLLLLAGLGLAQARGCVAPKQMLREAAGYLSAHVPEGAPVLVVPSGPTLAGIAHYSRPDLHLKTSPAFDPEALACGRTEWAAVERLAAGYGAGSYDLPGDDRDIEVIRFAAVDIVRLRCDASRH